MSDLVGNSRSHILTCRGSYVSWIYMMHALINIRKTVWLLENLLVHYVFIFLPYAES